MNDAPAPSGPHTPTRLGVPGIIAIVCACAGLIIVVVSAITLIRTFRVPAAGEAETAAKEAQSVELYRAGFAKYLAQFQGRSLFRVPAAAPAVEAPEPDVMASDVAPPAPTSYGGPAIIAMINEAVWFDDGAIRRVGTEKDGEIRVVAARPPWEARVEWRGVEFTVPFFARDGLVWRDGLSPPPTEAPAPVDPPVKPVAAPTPTATPVPSPPVAADSPAPTAPPAGPAPDPAPEPAPEPATPQTTEPAPAPAPGPTEGSPKDSA